jgi:hypothetical protein
MMTIALRCMRAKHYQRSIIIKVSKLFLHGACLKGKGKPGYKWSIPRFFLGVDIGMKIAHRWLKESRRQGRPLPYLLFDEETHEPLSVAHINQAGRAVMQQIGISDPGVFSTRGLRRVAPSVGAMLGLEPDMLDALGDWEATKGNTMRVRYSGTRYLMASEAKLLVTWVIEATVTTGDISWEQVAAQIADVDIQSMRAAVKRKISQDMEAQLEVPKEWIGKLVVTEKKYERSKETKQAKEAKEAEEAKAREDEEAEEAKEASEARAQKDEEEAREAKDKDVAWIMCRQYGHILVDDVGFEDDTGKT